MFGIRGSIGRDSLVSGFISPLDSSLTLSLIFGRVGFSPPSLRSFCLAGCADLDVIRILSVRSASLIFCKTDSFELVSGSSRIVTDAVSLIGFGRLCACFFARSIFARYHSTMSSSLLNCWRSISENVLIRVFISSAKAESWIGETFSSFRIFSSTELAALRLRLMVRTFLTSFSPVLVGGVTASGLRGSVAGGLGSPLEGVGTY